MNAYSMDLRERVVAAYDDGEGSQAELASRFRVGISWIGKLLRRRRQTGSIAPKPHSGGRVPAVAGEAADRLRVAVQADPDATLADAWGVMSEESIAHLPVVEDEQVIGLVSLVVTFSEFPHRSPAAGFWP